MTGLLLKINTLITCGTFRVYEKLIARGFLIAAFALVIAFIFLEVLLKPEIWVNYLGMPVLSIGMAFIGMTIECDRLTYVLSQN